MGLLITETGIGLENNKMDSEEVTFDRCFYIYGGPEHLQELEALSSRYTLLFNRRKGKLSADKKFLYDGKLKQIQQLFIFADEMSKIQAESNKGKKIDIKMEGNDDDMKNLHNSSVNNAADMAAGFTNALPGQNINDMIQRTGGRLESLHSEGVHRLSEMCCFAVTHLLILGKSIISHANKVQDEDTEALKIEWPEDPCEKAKLIRIKAESMVGYVEEVSNSFITGIQPWTFAHKFGDVVVIHVRCPRQVSNLKSWKKVALYFVSPENMSGCLHLTKEDKLEIKKIRLLKT